MHMIIQLIVAVIVVFFVRWMCYCIIGDSSRRKNIPPGPKRFLGFDNDGPLKKYMKETGSMYLAVMKLCRDYKSDIVYVPMEGEDIVFLQNEKLMDEYFFNSDIMGRPNSFFVRLRCLGVRQGLSMADGPLWEEQRTFAFRQLHNLGFGKASTEFLIHEELKSLFSGLSVLHSSDDLRKRVSKSLINSIWAFVTGSRFVNEAELNDLISIMEKRTKVFQIAGGVLTKYPWIRFIAPEWSGFTLINRLNTNFKDLIKKTIDEHKRTYSAHETRDFIDAFLHEMKGAKGSTSFTDDQLVMVCLDLFIAGSQTTSSALDFLLLRMIIHPDVQDKVYSEIDSIVRSGQDVTVLDRNKMPYTEAVLLESLRFAPSVPLVGPRRATSDTTLGGYNIPKEFTVFANIFPFLRDESKWPNPHNFDPTGNIINNKRLSKEDKSLSFGKGKRRCPGDSFAKAFMFMFFVSILQRYKLEMGDPNSPPSLAIVSGITCSPYPYQIKLIPRI